MSAGTLTLTNKSAAVTGSGTAFTTELAAGDFAVVTVGGIPYSLPVKSVNSNTSLTLVSNFTGPTQAGAAWYAVPRVAMNLVTAALVTQSAEALRGLNYDKQNWQGVFTATGTITVTLPDGSTFTGPSWKYLSDNMAIKSSNVDFAKVTSTVVDGRGFTHVGSRPNINDIYTYQPADTLTPGTYPNEIRGQWFNDLWRIGGLRGGGQELESFSIRVSGATTQYWTFNRSNSAINTISGSITPVVSDVRVKNEKRIIGEEEAIEFIQGWESILYELIWSPGKTRIGFRAQDIYMRNPDLIDRVPLSDGEGGMIDDGMVVDVAEVASAYLVPVVQQLLRRVNELEEKLALNDD